MALRMKLAVYGWMRENYKGNWLDDITNIVYQYYLIQINSKILSTDEQISLYNLLFDRIKKQKGNETIKSMETKLLFRASEHNFDPKKFQEFGVKSAPTLVIVHNHHDNVFGGYTKEGYGGSEYDEHAFIWMVRPKVKAFELKPGKKAIMHDKYSGPAFGEGQDFWCNYYGDDTNNGCLAKSFDFDAQEMSGGPLEYQRQDLFAFRLNEYEVFQLTIS